MLGKGQFIYSTCKFTTFLVLRSYKNVLLTNVRQIVEQDSVIDYYGEKKKFGYGLSESGIVL